MLRDARMEAVNRMINEVKKVNADAIVNVRFATSQTASGAVELLAYGTAGGVFNSSLLIIQQQK